MKAFSKIFLAAGAAVALSATLALAADTTPRNTAGAYGCPGAAYSGQMGPGMMGAGYGHMGYGRATTDRMGYGRDGRDGMMRGVSATGADSYRMGPRATGLSGGAGRTL